MFYSLLPIILIFASLGAIVFIVARKFPQLAALDSEQLPEVKQAQVKEDIQFQKFLRFLNKFGGRWQKKVKAMKWCAHGWQDLQNRFRTLVHSLQERYKKSVFLELKEALKKQRIEKAAVKAIIAAPKQSKKQALEFDGNTIQNAETAREKGDLAASERLFIEAVKQNPREVEAYRGLGKTYLAMGKYKEAKETFEFLLKLKPGDDRAFNWLGRVAEAQGKRAEAIKYLEESIKSNDHSAVRFYDLGRLYAAVKRPAAALRNFARALELEQNNPKYLDQLLEMSIITGDTGLAQETYNRFRLVNPENQKLPEFKQRIEEMEE